SMRRMPDVANHKSEVSLDRTSPAETDLHSEDRSYRLASPAIARYMVGAVNRHVAPNLATASRSASGVGFSSITVAARNLNGNTTKAPRPKVKPNGGLPI